MGKSTVGIARMAGLIADIAKEARELALSVEVDRAAKRSAVSVRALVT